MNKQKLVNTFISIWRGNVNWVEVRRVPQGAATTKSRTLLSPVARAMPPQAHSEVLLQEREQLASVRVHGPQFFTGPVVSPLQETGIVRWVPVWVRHIVCQNPVIYPSHVTWVHRWVGLACRNGVVP